MTLVLIGVYLPLQVFGLLAIAWTRLYLGVHFPSDILVGWMVSLTWAFGVSLLIKPHLTDENAVNDTEPNDTEVSASGSLEP
jgi:undecaprenyl-diphosphatase